MTTPRARRTPTAQPGIAVAVVGARGPIGAPIVEALRRDRAIGRVIAIDAEGPLDSGSSSTEPVGADADLAVMQHEVGDATDPSIAKLFAGAQVVVHAGVRLDPDLDPQQRSHDNIRGTQTISTAAAAAGASRLVIMTGAQVYGADPGHPVPLDEDATLAATPSGLPGDLLEMETISAAAQRVHPGLTVTVLRPATIVGPGIDTVLTRHFEAPRLMVVRESLPLWQFIHVDDLASAVGFAVRGDVLPDGGAATVGCDGHLDLNEVEEITGLRRVAMPTGVVFGAADRLHRAGLVPAPGSELAYVVYPWVISSARLRAAGWQPRHTNAEVLAELMDLVGGERAVAGRRWGSRDATLAGGAAAGAATVAVLGAAAFVRRARRARGL